MSRRESRLNRYIACITAKYGDSTFCDSLFIQPFRQINHIGRKIDPVDTRGFEGFIKMR